MTDPGERFAAAACTFEGTPFRLHGRQRNLGLDCIGLVGAALAACGHSVTYPHGYRLRNADISGWLAFAVANGLVAASGRPLRGDIFLTRPGPAQHHLLIDLGDQSFIHAHAGLRRVVIQNITLPTPPLAHWRVGSLTEQSWPR